MKLPKGKEEMFMKHWIEDYNCVLQDDSKNLGIPSDGYIYHITSDEQERSIEFNKTEKFLEWLLDNHPDKFNDNAKIQFINYGDTELVYVVDELDTKRTLLVGQPNTKFGTVKIEFDNLQKLYQYNPSEVVCPTIYFSHDDREAYVTPYFNQARCIASQEIGWGAYIPDSIYHFKKYSEEDEYVVCTAIVANLIRMYNQDEKLGIASCKIGGGDFILEKEWDIEQHTMENTLNRMHLIAARELISIELSDYIGLLRDEFSKRTYYKNIAEKDPNILINLKNREPMKRVAIEDGIALGLKLRKY